MTRYSVHPWDNRGHKAAERAWLDSSGKRMFTQASFVRFLWPDRSKPTRALSSSTLTRHTEGIWPDMSAPTQGGGGGGEDKNNFCFSVTQSCSPPLFKTDQLHSSTLLRIVESFCQGLCSHHVCQTSPWVTWSPNTLVRGTVHLPCSMLPIVCNWKEPMCQVAFLAAPGTKGHLLDC